MVLYQCLSDYRTTYIYVVVPLQNMPRIIQAYTHLVPTTYIQMYILHVQLAHMPLAKQKSVAVAMALATMGVFPTATMLSPRRAHTFGTYIHMCISTYTAEPLVTVHYADYHARQGPNIRSSSPPQELQYASIPCSTLLAAQYTAHETRDLSV